jgi:hypothetical protein
MDKIKQLELEIDKIKSRNAKVEADKAWETSLFRKLIIIILTYIVITLFFLFADLPNPFINAIIPTTGFVLSTLSIPILKKFWIKHYYKKYEKNI